MVSDPVFYADKPFEIERVQVELRSPGWYFWDEAGLDCYGPYLTEDFCREKLQEYGRRL